MALSKAELALEKTRLAKDTRLARVFGERGQPGAAERFNVQTREQAVAQRETQLNPTPAALGKDQLIALLDSGDREELAARLRAQAAYASQVAADKRARGKDRDIIREYEDRARYSTQAANLIAAGSGPLSNNERVLAGRSRSPEDSTTELRARYATGEVRERARQAQREDREAEAAGYDSVREMREAEKAAQKQAAIDQRNRFLASGKQIEGAFGRYAVEKLGYKPNVTDAEVRTAQLELVKRGQAELIDPVTGRAYQRQPGNVLVSVRTQEEAQRAKNQAAQQIAQSGRGNFQDVQGNIYQVPPPDVPAIQQAQPEQAFRSDFTGGKGVISAAPPRTLKVFNIDTRYEIKGSTSRDYQAEADQYRDVDYARSGKAEFLAAATGVFEGGSAPLIKTKEFLTGIKDLIVSPIDTTQALAADFGESPSAVGGQLAGTALFFKGVQVATPAPIKQAIPRPTVETLELPQVGGETATVTAIGVRSGSRSVTVGGRVKTPEGTSYSLGRPDVTEALRNLKEATDVKIGGPLQTSIIEKSLRTAEDATPRAQQVIPVAQSIIRKTQSTRATLPESIILETERLPPQGVQVVLDIAKQEQATVFGSLSRRQTSEAFPTPRDIDVRLRDASPEVVKRVTEQTIKDLESVGLKARERADTPGAIEVQQPGGAFEKAVEFKGKNQVPGEEAVPEEVLGFKKEGKPIEIAGQRFTTLNEELRGVTQGVVRVRKENGILDISPPPKRAKDVGSLITSAEVLRQSQVLERPGLAADIQKIREFYQFDVDVSPPNTQIVVADFSPGRGARSSNSPITIPEQQGRLQGLPDASPSPRSGPSASPRSPGSPASPVTVSPISSPSSSPQAEFSPLAPASPPSQSPRSSPKASPVPVSPGPASPSTSPSPVSPVSISPFPSPSPPSPSPASPGSPSPPSSPPPFSPPPEVPSPFPRRTPEEQSSPLFDVEVRQRGQFYQFNTQGLRLEEAARLADTLVNTKAAASFKITYKGTGRPVTGPERSQVERLLTPGRYRESKVDRDIFVEKSKFRINTPGEKVEISPKNNIFGDGKNPFGGKVRI